ncbi:hypothetical protein BC940DRAFT_348020 [Gongronella butleri]|nr:hypothetical protein BC940DRAFT_348020 [Gongronella butleri]
MPTYTQWLVLFALLGSAAALPIIDLSQDHQSASTHTATATASATSSPTATNTANGLASDHTIYGDDSRITIQMGVVGGVFLALSLYLLAVGYRFFRSTLATFGFLAFGLVTWVGLTNCQPSSGYASNDITMIVVPAGLGVLGGAACFLFWSVGLYVIAGVGGLAFAMFILCWRSDLLITSDIARACYLVAVPLVFAGLTFLLERHVLIFAIAFTGAYLFTLGVDVLAHTGYLAGIRTLIDRNPAHTVHYDVSRNVYVLLAVTLFLFLVSYGWQHLTSRGRHFGIKYVVGPAAVAAIAAKHAQEKEIHADPEPSHHGSDDHHSEAANDDNHGDHGSHH